MPRARRYAPPSSVVHAVNRGNEKRRLFEHPSDYDAFLDLMSWAKERCPVRILGYCLMPNHWHLVLSPIADGGVGRYLHRVCTTHAVRLRGRTGTIGFGHVYQQRYHATLVDSERYFYEVLRYVEANASRAGLVPQASEWPWSSLHERISGGRGLLDTPPLMLPTRWRELVEQGMDAETLAAIRGTYPHHRAEIR